MIFLAKTISKTSKKKFAAPFANGSWLKTVSKCPSIAPLFLTVVYIFSNPHTHITNGCKTVSKVQFCYSIPTLHDPNDY
jgi:hypothetical protein